MDKLLQGDSETIEYLITQERNNPKRKQAEVAERYYDYDHDILKHRIFYINDNDQLAEDEYASNITIPHPFFTEIVDQSVNTLLSDLPELYTEDETYQAYLEEYWDADTHVFLQEMIEGASIKSEEYAFVKQIAGDEETTRVTFQVSDSMQTFEVIDDTGDVIAHVRFYTKNLIRDDKETPVEHCEVWTDETVTFYVKNEDNDWVLNENVKPNPRSHVLAEDVTENGEKVLLGKSFGHSPFFKLKNNKRGKTDLEPIKDLIDDYDLMNAMMSNNLQDYSEAIYVVKGYEGDDLSKLRQNLKGKGVAGVAEEGDVDLKTYNIPVEGRIKKMEHDKQNIYKFGMAFDSTAISDSQGNVTNVQILAGYSLLMMKLNKKESYLRTLIDWMLEVITEDINRRFGTAYDYSDIEVIIERETMVNRLENAQIEKHEEETRQLKISTLLDVAVFLPQEKVLREICEILELEWEEVENLLKQEAYLPSLAGVGDEEITEEEGDEEDGEDEQVGAGDREDIST